MTRYLRGCLFLTGLVFLGLFVIGMMLPRTWEVERTRLVRAAPEAVHAVIEDPRTWPRWTHWTTERDATLKLRFEGPERGAGAKLCWEGQLMGFGELELTRAEPGRGVEYQTTWRGTDHGTRGALVLEPAPEGTRITWRDGGSLDWNPITRFFAPLFEAKLGKDFDAGLARLARLAGES